MLARRLDDRGYTLVEMLVTIVVFTIVMGSLTAVIITALRHETSLRDRDGALASVRNSIENVDRDIRSANPLCYGTGTEIAMLELATTSGPVIADYQVINSGTALQYTEYAASPATSPNLLQSPHNITCTDTTVNGTVATTALYYANTQLVRRIVIRDLVKTTSSPVFLQSGSTYDTCPANGATGSGTTLNATTSALAAAVSAITVNVSDKPSSLSQPVSASDCGTYLTNYLNSL